jgi:hypothetical protein
MAMFRRRALPILLVVFCSLFAWAGKSFVMPAVQPAKTYPARDAHTDEGVTVALDPYDMPDKANIFSVHYNEIGYMPILVVITNDSDQPVSFEELQAQLVTVDRTKIEPATEDDLYRRLAHPSRSNNTIPIPLPIPHKVKGTVNAKAMDEIQNSRFAAHAVEPHSTQAGFMFFDISGISTPLAGAHFYLSGIRNAKGDELMYFEVALEKYLSAPSK